MSRNPSGAQATEAIGVEPTLPSLQLLLREPVTTASFLDSDATVLDRGKDCRLRRTTHLLVFGDGRLPSTCYRYALRHPFRPLSLIYYDYYWQTSPELQDQFVIRYG